MNEESGAQIQIELLSILLRTGTARYFRIIVSVSGVSRSVSEAEPVAWTDRAADWSACIAIK